MNPESLGVDNESPQLRTAQRVFDLAFLGAVACVAGAVLWGMGRGLDLTDESSYLLSARSPGRIVSVFNFGHYTGVLYALAGQHLGGFRGLGLLVLLASAGLFVRTTHRSEGAGYWVVPTGLVVLGALGFYSHHWIPSPGYQWLTLVGVLLGFAGVGASLARCSRVRPLGAFTFGASGVLTFMGKPPSAVALAALGGACWLIHGLWTRRLAAQQARLVGPLRWQSAGVGVALGAFVACAVHMLCFDGPLAWYRELTVGFELLSTLGGHGGVLFTVFRDCLRLAAEPWRQAPVWWSVAPLVVLLVSRTSRRHARLITPLALAALLVHQVWGGTWQARQGSSALNFTAAVLVLGTLYQRCALRTPWRVLLPTIGWGVFLCSGVLATGYASNMGLVWSSGWAIAFFAAGGACFVRLLDDLSARVYAAGFALGVCLALGAVFQLPYRLTEPLWKQDQPSSGLVRPLPVEAKTARYLREVVAAGADFEPGTLLIDLTGDSPGAVYALGGEVIGHPWLTGGQPGSETFAIANLALADPDELAKAWLLLAPGGALEIPSSALTSSGLDFPAGYVVVGEARSPRRRERQILFRPR